MKLVISLVLVAVIAFLTYLLIININEPIRFMAEKDRREQVVIARLKQIRTAQEFYRDITGAFASNFDTLKQVLTTGQFKIISVLGDPDDPNFDRSNLQYDTTYYAAIDSIRSLKINLDSLRFVPFGGGATFDIAADTITYQSTLVNVVEVGVPRRLFMGKYADPLYSKYDNRYDPNSRLKFGDLSTPNTSGNWER
ncbi:MAG TPA: hypothetical protein VI603_17800 [Saprospiraceae bacterium]|nr:hypothetical protein [Saprospiraceae bacterium]